MCLYFACSVDCWSWFNTICPFSLGGFRSERRHRSRTSNGNVTPRRDEGTNGLAAAAPAPAFTAAPAPVAATAPNPPPPPAPVSPPRHVSEGAVPVQEMPRREFQRRGNGKLQCQGKREFLLLLFVVSSLSS